jgi:hypothetical protein
VTAVLARIVGPRHAALAVDDVAAAGGEWSLIRLGSRWLTMRPLSKRASSALGSGIARILGRRASRTRWHVQFVACIACTRAIRRIVAAIGSDARLMNVETAETTAVASSVPRIRPRLRPRMLSAEVPAERIEHYVDKDGDRLRDAFCGGQRTDGMWIGWVEFVAIGDRRVWRTGTETTQPDRDSLLYWATGLEPLYFEGAFARAR